MTYYNEDYPPARTMADIYIGEMNEHQKISYDTWLAISDVFGNVEVGRRANVYLKFVDLLTSHNVVLDKEHVQ